MTTALRSLRPTDLGWVLEHRPAGRGAAIDRVHLWFLAATGLSERPTAWVDFCGRLSQRGAVADTSRALRANDTHPGAGW